MIPPPSQISLVAIAEGGKGRGFDLIDEVEGLQFSNVNPGGDEVCTFTLNREWFAENPEVGRGNLLRVIAGIDVLWQGRIEEIDRATGDAESLAVTAYGLGNRLSDTTFREIYIDRDLGKWGVIPNPRVVALGENFQTNQGSTEIRQSGTGQSKLALILTRLQNAGAKRGIVEAWYDAAGISIGNIYSSRERINAAASGSWQAILFIVTDQTGATRLAESGNVGEGASSSTISASANGGVFAAIQFWLSGEFTGDSEWRFELGPLIVEGQHGLTRKGEPLTGGFSADQIVGHILSRASGISPRRIGGFSYVIPQFTIDTPTTPKDGIALVNAFSDADYGTWGPDSPLDNSTNGYFDYTEKESSVQHWFATRSDFDLDLNFHTETQSLFDAVDVSWTDEAGASHVERFSIVSTDLLEAELSPRIFPLDAGTTTKVGAQILAELFLNVFAGFAPARGSGSILGQICHYRRGKLPAYYARADGSNIRIPDILPAETAFALDSTPDRRTIFPIKRVNIDLSGDAPKTTVEFDQTNDSLAMLLAQQATQAALVG